MGSSDAGSLRVVYRNENAIWVESRTLHERRRIVVEVLKVEKGAGGAAA